MIHYSPSLRLIALDEFTRRRKDWQKARRAGAAEWPGDPANENMTLWTAIAVAAGVGREGPIKLLAGGDPVTVRPLSGRGFRKLDHCRGDLDELLRIEDDADLGALDGDHHPRGTLFARVLRRIKGDGSRIDLASATGAHLPAEGDQLETGLHRGQRGHDQAVRLALRHAPDANVVVVHANGRKSIFWDQAKHLICSLIALRWIRSGAKDARRGEEAQ